jgi:[acyl-carrier-protein] S-malonyltransferase
VERAVGIATERGVKRAVMLNVSAPFHCRLMAPAADAMARALSAVALNAPRVPLYANVTAAPVADPDAIRAALVEQVTGTVRWRESVAAMAGAGADQFYELGAGKVLTGLVKRIAPQARAAAVGTPADVAAFTL